MMSAENFARQSVVWHRSTPVLESYMRWLNDHLFGIGQSVRSIADAELNSLIAEIAFRTLFQPFEQADTSARMLISTLPRGAPIAVRELSHSDLQEVALLRDNLEADLKLRATESQGSVAQFHPIFAGCGVVESARGDILLGSELIEIKAVQRSFRSTDMRQALTYAAMAYTVGTPITSITLLNPRWGTYRRIDALDLAPDVGAGSWPELMKDLVDAMSGLEVSL